MKVAQCDKKWLRGGGVLLCSSVALTKEFIVFLLPSVYCAGVDGLNVRYVIVG